VCVACTKSGRGEGWMEPCHGLTSDELAAAVTAVAAAGRAACVRACVRQPPHITYPTPVSVNRATRNSLAGISRRRRRLWGRWAERLGRGAVDERRETVRFGSGLPGRLPCVWLEFGWVGLDPTQFFLGRSQPVECLVALLLLGTEPTHFSVWLKNWGQSGSVQCLVEGI